MFFNRSPTFCKREAQSCGEDGDGATGSGGTKGRPAGARARAPAKLFFFNIINNKLLILNYYFISYV
jgi:hypothetical protein